jgi:hypothetical protein
MKKLRRSTWILTVVVLLASGTAIVTIRAAERATTQAAAKPGRPEPAAAKPVAPKTAAPAPGAPAPPEESATIRDDPTIAPDPKQSADNDVSFPADT